MPATAESESYLSLQPNRCLLRKFSSYAECSSPRAGHCSKWPLRPCMLWILAHQFTTDFGIESLPEPGQVSGCLYRPLIRGEQMDHYGGGLRADSRGVTHAEEILHARCDPWRSSAFIMHLDVFSIAG